MSGNWQVVRGGRGSGGGSGGRGRGSGSSGNKINDTFKTITYANSRALFYVVLKNKILAQYPDLRITVDEKQATNDRNDQPRIEIWFRMEGAPGDVRGARAKLEAHKVVKTAFIFQQDEKEGAQYLIAKAESAPERIQCALRLVTKGVGGGDMKVIISTVSIPGDGHVVDPASLERSARGLLLSEAANQQFRNPNNKAATRGGRIGRVNRGGGGLRPAEAPQHEAPQMPHTHQIVVGRDGGSGSRKGPATRSAEVARADHMPPEQAREYLARLVTEKAGRNAEADLLAWLSFLYDVEAHYVLAQLSEYEMHGARLLMTGDVKDVAKVVISLDSGIRPFTERRPSVQCDDDVILRRVGASQLDIYRCPVFFVTATEVHIHISTQKDPKGKVLEAAKGEVKLHNLRQQIREGRLFDVIFEPGPHVNRCAQLALTAAKGYMALKFLEERDPGLQIPDLQGYLNQKFQFSGNGGRGGARSARGGRFKESGGGTATGKDPFEGLEEKQRFASQLITSPPEGIRKVFIDGPAGTGKTETICHAVCQLLKNPKNRILMLSPSHSAGDVIALRLLQMQGRLRKEDLLRCYPASRHPLRCPEALFTFTNFRSRKSFSQLRHEDRFDMSLVLEKDFLTHRVVVGTLAHSGMIAGAVREGAKPFTHIFIDEVAQASITETLGGVNFSATDPNVMFVFSGDEKQIGPKCNCKVAQQWLNQSACRFLKHTAVHIHLDVSYRATPALAMLQSALFYKGELKAADAMNEDGINLDDWSGHRGNPQTCRFIHVGKAPRSHKASWINRGEISVVLNTILSLHSELNVDLDSIAVFTQYREHAKALISDLRRRNAHGVQVREIEDFHGDQRDIVIMSLVRDVEDELSFDRRSLNTAIGRAGKLVIIIGNGEMVSRSRDRKWRDLMLETLIPNEAVDGYDADEGVWDDNLWTPLPTKPIAVEVGLGTSKTNREIMEERFKRITREEVLANELEYFVGVVSGDRTWEEEGSMFVRHRHISGVDVMVEDQSTSGFRKDFVFDGDVVAVKIDDRVSRWPSSITDISREKTPLITPTCAASSCAALATDDTTTIEDFDSCCPQILNKAQVKNVRPTGTVHAILHQPTLPPFVGRINPSGDFIPVNRRFPTLVCPKRPKNISDELCVATLERSANQEPFYKFKGLAPSPYSLGDVLRDHSSYLPNGAITDIEFSGTHDAFVLSDRYCNAYRAVRDGHLSYLMVYIPLVCLTMAQDEEMEKEAASRCGSLYQQAIRGVCEQERIHLTSGSTAAASLFSRVSKEEDGEPQPAIMIRFPVPPKADETVQLDNTFFFDHTDVKVVMVQCFDFDQAQEEISFLTDCVERVFEARQNIFRGEWKTGFDGENPNHMANEMDNWANWAAANYLMSIIPKQSIFVRQDLPLTYVDQFTKAQKTRVERQEYWVPTKEPVLRGFHAGTGFPIYTTVTNPWERYGDVLTQRLLLVATKIKQGSSSAISVAEQKLCENVRGHANWLNTLPIVYGEKPTE